MFSEKYFDMSKKNCREGFNVYKKFLVRMDKVAEFLKVAEVSVIWVRWKVAVAGGVTSSFATIVGVY